MKTNVLVVGAGPVGLTMAAELARYGVPVRIVEKAPERTDKSKALVLWSRSLELIDRMGCTAAFVDAGLKAHAANIIAGSQPIAQVHFDGLKTPYPYALMLPQCETERLMENHLNACGIKIERSVELQRFVANPDGVTATLHQADGRDETLEVDWLIGCDGARSAVRHQLGLEFEGDTLPTDWILADVHLAGLLTKPDELNMYWHADGVLAIFPISAGRYRVIADMGNVKLDVPRADPTVAEVQAILDKRGPGGIAIGEPIWLSSFRINERKVTDYRAGRTFLVGDAAHIHSPAGGQGMNTGMQDAFNLAWKLALVYHGVAKEPLLDSYSIERSAVGHQVLTDASRLTTVAILKGGVAQNVRNHMASLLFGLPMLRTGLANKFTELSIGYPHSPLTIPGRHGAHGLAAGQRAPIAVGDEPVGSGNSPRFAIFGSTHEKFSVLLERFPRLIEPTVRAPIDPNVMALVRPDGYIGLLTGGGAVDWDEIGSYLDKIAGNAEV
jgi:2-polyprenyl-6-methoxyphenol hydroxylase-like FAD-dependent oxidoreductase